ncbi:Eco57I restriction-modification methylase [Flavobacteriaceae bacterium MAR_2009_75]|nr:Eco57I restriction-modification methylase [Flavobacteriaceae bacterium MAR_2009_75]
MSLFQNSVLNKYLKGLEHEKVDQAYERFTNHFHNPTIQENIRNSKEEQYQGEFLIDLFVNVLGYTKNPTPNFNLTTELKNIKGSKKTDGAILSRGLNPLATALAVIELKGTNTTDLSKVETQAFGYKNNQPGCNYVITSNFEKLRFYIDNAVDFEEFNLFQLSKERFELLWLCLSSEYLLKDIPKKIKDESLTQEENVTKKLYKDYASFRNEIFDAIQKENPEYDKLTLFKKTQKLLDRFLFIFFAEDRLLLPPNSIRSIVNQWTDLRDKYDEYFPLYDRFKKYFGYMNTGHKGQQHDIFAYNGGLFAPDEVLDNIKINDDLLYKHTLNLSNYDFESEVSVNILGHIFEHSLNDIDEIQAEIQGVSTEQAKTKRKKDGVFYTPKYITKYIVDNTVGKLCEEKKTELDIHEAEYEKERKGRQKATLKKLTQKLEDYRKWLLQLTICDPACGSGAFLNQALEFLIAEHRYIDELQAKLFGDAMILSEVENAILENNLFGVDINEESVEIAKLSLWLRTAQKGRKLTALNHNIKCGNSLIDDPSVAADKAFHWQSEFPDIFTEKNKKAYHITTALHDSRTSQRMIDYKVRERRELGTNPLPNYTKLEPEEEVIITKEIIAVAEEKQLHIMSYNICGDHIHLLLVCEEDELATLVKHIKGRTARAHNSANGINPLVRERNEKSVSLWTQKYGSKEIKDDEQLRNTINYIQTNRQKHELPTIKGLQPLVSNPILNQTYDQAFAVEYKGGFDVVIGNPPYGAFVSKTEKKYYKINYKVTEYNYDTYNFFFEKSIDILKEEMYLGFITPNTFLVVENGTLLRKYLFQENTLIELFETFNVFPDAVVEPMNIIIKKLRPNSNDVFKVKLENRKTKNAAENKFSYDTLLNNEKLIFNYRESKEEGILFKKIESSSLQLLSVANVTTGIKPYQKGKGIPKQTTDVVKNKPFTSYHKDNDWYPLIRGTQVNRYLTKWDGEYIKYGPWLAEPRKPEIFFEPKLLIRRTDDNLMCTYDNQKFVAINSVHTIQSEKEDLKYLLALINSRLLNWYFRHQNFHMVDKPLAEVKVVFVERLPYKQTCKDKKKVLVKKVEVIIELNKVFYKNLSILLNLLNSKFSINKFSKKLQNWHELDFGEFLKELEKLRKKEAKNANKGFQPLALSEEAEWMQYFNEQKQKATELKAEIDKTDSEIDAMVYELYGLTDEEIQIVEEAMP